MTTKLTEKKLKSFIKTTVHKAFAIELMKLRSLLIPAVSAKEQKEIEARYKKPKREKKSVYSIQA